MNKGFFIFFIFLISSPALAQTKDFLIQEKDQITQEITYIKDQINQAEKDKKNNLQTLLLYEKDAKLRESLIQNYEKEILVMGTVLDSLETSLNQLYENEINLQQEINHVEQQIKLLSDLLSQTIRQIYFSNTNNNFFYLFFKTSSFDETINEYLYLKTIKNTAQTLSGELKLEKSSLNTLQNELLINKEQINQSILKSNELINKRRASINEKEGQIEDLNNQSRIKEGLIQELTKQIELLKKEILEKEEMAEKIENDIFELSKENKNLNNKDVNFEFYTISFEEQKGSLDWPAKNAVILSGFGTVPHKEFPGLKDVNRGITLAVSINTKI